MLDDESVKDEKEQWKEYSAIGGKRFKQQLHLV